MFWKRPHLSRRLLFRHSAAAVSGYFLLPGFNSGTIARAGVATKSTAKYCIFILMSGGPSQIDTFDMKVGEWTPKDLDPTDYNGIKFPRGLMPRLAAQIGDLAFIRSARAWAAVHGLARIWVQIGRNPTAATSRAAPHIGSVVSLELSSQNKDAFLPAFVSLNTLSGVGNGWLPPGHAPFFAQPAGGGLANSRHNDGAARFDRRYGLLLEMDSELRANPELGAAAIQTSSYNDAARKLIYNGNVDSVFTFDQNERNRYGATSFGNSCIAARNMLRAKSGVRFIQIMQSDWDQHDNIWAPNAGHYAVARQFDNALSTLISDLKSDGLFDDTLIICMGEFGRTTGALTSTKGRDHLLQQSILVAGASVRGGRAIGSTNVAGSATLEPGWSKDRDVRPEDIEATIYSALGIDWTTIRRDDPTGRGFEYVPDAGKGVYAPVHELW
jgi:hypothetical protein